MSSKSHHFHGIATYANELMDLAEGLPVFTGRGKKPSNKEVKAAIVSINKCQKDRQRGSFFSTDRREKTCSCGWHVKAAARKLSKKASSSASILQPSDPHQPPAFHQPPAATIVLGPVTLEPPLAPRRKVPATRKALPLSSATSSSSGSMLFSLGPEQISDATRAEERQEHARQNPPKKRTQAQPSQKTKKPKLIPPELEERQKRAQASMLKLGVTPIEERSLEGKRLCSVCHQLRTNKDKTPHGDIHRVLGRSNKIWCPYSDPKSILEAFEKEQKERTQESWRRANEAKKLKKQSTN